jgi:hypothetical protein
MNKISSKLQTIKNIAKQRSTKSDCIIKQVIDALRDFAIAFGSIPFRHALLFSAFVLLLFVLVAAVIAFFYQF